MESGVKVGGSGIRSENREMQERGRGGMTSLQEHHFSVPKYIALIIHLVV